MQQEEIDAAKGGYDVELEYLRAERDRLEADRDFLLSQNTRLAESREALAAENAGLRDLAGELIRFLEMLDLPEREGNDGGFTEAASVRRYDHLYFKTKTALASPSPLTQAVERALEAVGRRVAAKRALDAANPGSQAGPPFAQKYSTWHKALVEAKAADLEVSEAHDALRALLEGREGES